jgi:hypothetical protein
MICPVCKSEYREGFYQCAECNVALVKEQEDDPESDYDDAEASADVTGSGNLIVVMETDDSNYLSEIVQTIEEQNVPYLVPSGTAFNLDL